MIYLLLVLGNFFLNRELLCCISRLNFRVGQSPSPVQKFAQMPLVQFWTPSPVTQCRGERVQDHLSAHARAEPIVAPITSTCLFRSEIHKLARKLFQHAAGKNVGERSYGAEKTCQTELRELLSPWNYHSDKCKSSYFQSPREK